MLLLLGLWIRSEVLKPAFPALCQAAPLEFHSPVHLRDDRSVVVEIAGESRDLVPVVLLTYTGALLVDAENYRTG
jgi:di/tricarboxylate transporter